MNFYILLLVPKTSYAHRQNMEDIMGGFFGVASKEDCTFDLFFGTDYHSHLGTRRAGMAVYSKEHGFEIGRAHV